MARTHVCIMLMPMRYFVDFKMFGTYTLTIINAAALYGTKRTLNSWGAEKNRAILIFSLCTPNTCLRLRVKTSGDENGKQQTPENVTSMHKSH